MLALGHNPRVITGAVQEIQKLTLFAERSMCYNHALNLSISKSSNVSSVRNAVSTIRDVASFFNGSAKRHNALEKVLNKALKGCYETRWVDHHDSISQFKSDFLKIYKALDVISNWSENISSPKAEAFKKYIVTVDFVVTLYCLADVLAVTKPLSVLLQKSNFKADAKKLIDATLDTLKKKRQNSEENLLVCHGRGFGENIQQLLCSIIGELCIWKQHWLNESQNDNKVPDNVCEASTGCDCDAFNLIKQFLSILGALPVRKKFFGFETTEKLSQEYNV
nr:unnamed protein product [Callosobruchus analis]